MQCVDLGGRRIGKKKKEKKMKRERKTKTKEKEDNRVNQSSD